MGNSVFESARQAFVVMKNEIKKYFSGKRMFVFLVLLGIIVFVIVVAPYFFDSKANPMYFYMMSSLVVLMAATLFGSISIVSEFEERTALILFTRPIRKTSIFIGKMMACLTLTIAFMLLYYIIAMVVSAIVDGIVSGELFVSFGLSCVYAFGTIGIAMFISSIMKKGSTATIITFVILAVIVTAVSMVLEASSVNHSWMIDTASESIMNCSTDYRDWYNGMMASIQASIGSPETFIAEPFYNPLLVNGTSYDGLILALTTPTGPNGETAWYLGEKIAESIGASLITAPDYLHDILVMFAWGAIGMVAAFLAFLRREF